jgi:hypothetical protein
MAVGFPMERKFVARERLPEGIVADLQIVFEG